MLITIIKRLQETTSSPIKYQSPLRKVSAPGRAEIRCFLFFLPEKCHKSCDDFVWNSSSPSSLVAYLSSRVIHSSLHHMEHSITKNTFFFKRKQKNVPEIKQHSVVNRQRLEAERGRQLPTTFNQKNNWCPTCQNNNQQKETKWIVIKIKESRRMLIVRSEMRMSELTSAELSSRMGSSMANVRGVFKVRLICCNWRIRADLVDDPAKFNDMGRSIG